MTQQNLLRNTLPTYGLWLAMAVPALLMMNTLAGGADPERLLHPTGELSARFMILAMTATPLRMIFPKLPIVRWLMKHRRHFGVAAFAYAVLHTAFYVIDMATLQAIMSEFWVLGIWTGWLAMFIFVPLAATSNDWSVRMMGPRWKQLQRLTYIAAVATLVHWITVHHNAGAALAHFVPLAALEAYRIAKNFSNRQRTNPSTLKLENTP